MSRTCIVIHDLSPLSSGNPTSLSDGAWHFARALVASGENVTFLHTDLEVGGASRDLSAAARDSGLRYVSLRDVAPAFDVPLFPSAVIHANAYRTANALKELKPDRCLVFDQPAYVAVAINARRTGLSFVATRFVIATNALPRELARMKQDELPPAGREELVHDYLERKALAGADEVFAADDTIGQALREGGFARTVRTLPMPTQSAGDRLLAEWRAALSTTQSPSPATNMPRVTVCMPFYEQPDYLNEALASLAAQSTAPHEVIVMDDGSKTPAALTAFTSAESQYASRGWKFLRQPNAGPAAARNRMVELATGDAVLFCDADNRFRPEMIAAMTQAFARTGADCVTAAFQTFTTAPNPDPDDRGYVFSPLGDCIELGLIENVLGDTNFLVRRSTFLKEGGFSAERLADEDWQFLLRLLSHGGHVEAVPGVLFDYRRMPTSRARRQGEFASAAITLAPILAETNPTWRRLWPHLVAAIRNPQVPRLEHELLATRMELQAKLEKNAFDLAEAQRLTRRRQWEIVIRQTAADRATALAQDAQAARDAAVQRAEELEKRLADLERESAAVIAARDQKIKRMQDSWSWRATSPARAVRRAVLDSRQRTETNARGEVVSPDNIRLALDRPAFWDAAPAAGTIAGWCLLANDRPPRAMRVFIGEQSLPGQIGLPREDVAAAHDLPKESGLCGFEFRYRLPADADHQVRVEAQMVDGNWRMLREVVLHTSSEPRDVHDYAAWVENFGTLTPEKATALRARLAALPAAQRPLISVLMPVHNPAEQWLTRAIESVREQVYENWELCIADDASTAPHIRPLLEKYQAADPRIRVAFRPKNGHISAASNSALELVRGEFVALLDHDDELAPDALAEVTLLLATQPATDLVFTDEDKIDEQGRRRTPYFKPDYLPDLLLGQNCVSHLSVYRTSLVREVGGFRVGFEGSQDWDLALRVVDKTSPERVLHLPKVLYHWRTISGSTAVTVSAKDYSVDAARRALLDHFSRRGIKADVQPVTGHHWQVVYPVPDPAPLVSIIIPTKNAAELVRMCVASIIARTEYPRYEIIIVNNRSEDPATLSLFEQLKQEENIRVIDYDAPFNYSAINNTAAKQAHGEVLCFLNNDIEVITGLWLNELVSHALRPEIGAVGAMLYYPNSTIQHAGVVLGLGGVANHAFVNFPHGTDGYMNRARLAQNYSAITGACLAVRRTVFAQVSGFNESDLSVAFNDIDLCLRIRAAGYRNLWTPFAELFHYESASRGNDDTPEKRARFIRETDYMRQKWGALLDRDPAYNPNLALNLLGWALAWPPRA